MMQRSIDIPDRAPSGSKGGRSGGAKHPTRDRLEASTGPAPGFRSGRKRRWPSERPHRDKHAGVASAPQEGRRCSHAEWAHRRPWPCRDAARWPTPPEKNQGRGTLEWRARRGIPQERLMDVQVLSDELVTERSNGKQDRSRIDETQAKFSLHCRTPRNPSDRERKSPIFAWLATKWHPPGPQWAMQIGVSGSLPKAEEVDAEQARVKQAALFESRCNAPTKKPYGRHRLISGGLSGVTWLPARCSDTPDHSTCNESLGRVEPRLRSARSWRTRDLRPRSVCRSPYRQEFGGRKHHTWGGRREPHIRSPRRGSRTATSHVGQG